MKEFDEVLPFFGFDQLRNYYSGQNAEKGINNYRFKFIKKCGKDVVYVE